MEAMAQVRQNSVSAKRLASHLAVSVPVAAMVFGVLGPLIGLVIVLMPTLIFFPSTIVWLVLSGYSAFAIGGLAALVVGAAVAAGSPFVGSSLQFRLLAAFAGGLAMTLWSVLVLGTIESAIGLSFVGAGISLICTQILWDWPLQRKSHLSKSLWAQQEQQAF